VPRVTMFEEVRPSELITEAKNYVPCWPSIVVVGVAIQQQVLLHPAALQLWSSDSPQDEPFVAQFFGPPDLPQGLRIFKVSVGSSHVWTIMRYIVDKKVLPIADTRLSFENFEFSQAGIYSSDANPGYPHELDKYVDPWPKLFLRGVFTDGDQLLKEYATPMEHEFARGNFDFPSMSDAAVHLIGVRLGPSNHWRALWAALKLPIKLEAELEDGKLLRCLVQLPESLLHLSPGLRYLGESDEGRRYFDIPLTEATGTEDDPQRASFYGVHDVPHGYRPREVTLQLGHRRVESVRVAGSVPPSEAPLQEAPTQDAVAPKTVKRVFLGSTSSDLKDVRAELRQLIPALGCELVCFEDPKFRKAPGKHAHDVCLDNAAECDVYVLIIDERYGDEYDGVNPALKGKSVTWAELDSALEANRTVCTFVRRHVWLEKSTYSHNRDSGIDIRPFWAKDKRVFDFLEYVTTQSKDNWIDQFDDIVQLKAQIQSRLSPML